MQWDLSQTAGEVLIVACEKGHHEIGAMIIEAGKLLFLLHRSFLFLSVFVFCSSTGGNVNINNGKALQSAAKNNHLKTAKV
jgi:hypothetical protein